MTCSRRAPLLTVVLAMLASSLFSASSSSRVAPPVAVHVTISREQCTTVPRELFGVNTLYFQETDAARGSSAYRDSLEALGPTMMRYPGGTAGDNYLWETGKVARTDWYPHRSNPTTDADTTEFLQLASDFGATPLMVINYRSFAAAGRMEDCYRNAENWVSFVNDHYTTHILNWEVGNEVYFKTNHVNPEHYAESYITMRRRLQKIDPNLRLGLAMGNFWNNVPALTDAFNDRVMRRLDAPPDFIILHFYPAINPDTFTTSGMGMRNNIGWFRNALKKRGFDPELPIFVTEWNASSQSNRVQGQTVGHVLAVAQGLLELCDSNVKCATFWPLRDYGKALVEGKTFTLQPAGQMFAEMRRIMCGTRTMRVEMNGKADGLEVAAFKDPAAQKMRLVVLNRDLHTGREIDITMPGIAARTDALLTITATAAINGRPPDINATELRTTTGTLEFARQRAAFHAPPLSFCTLELKLPN